MDHPEGVLPPNLPSLPSPVHTCSSSSNDDFTSQKNLVFQAARDGQSTLLYALLAERSPPEQGQLLSAHTHEDGQTCTPLIIAARNGREKAVHTLVTKFRPPLGQTGVVRFGNYVIDGASALWCAAGAGHVSVVKELVKAGADVNQTTKINSTPLRAACFEGRLDIVQHLLESGADLHIANQYNNSCLMIAAYKGHLEVVKFLLQKGADPNVAANCGATALHFSAECGYVDIVRELYLAGAECTRTSHGMTPLLAAAERCQKEVVEYILLRPEISRRDRVEALELIGASFANDKDNYDSVKAFQYLRRAMEERWADSKEPLPKPVVPAVPAYNGHVECEAMEDLMALEHDHDALHMEGLAIRERILGHDNPEVPHPVIFRGAVFADSAGFDRCISLWLHALRLKQMSKSGVVKDLLRFAQVFSQMLRVGVRLAFENLAEVMRAAADEIKWNMAAAATAAAAIQKSQSPSSSASLSLTPPKEDPEAMQVDLESNMATFLYLMVILAKLKKMGETKAEEEFPAMQLVFEVVSMDPRTRSGASLLHLAVSSETPVDDFHTNDIVRFPCSGATKLLLEAGCDAGAMDRDRNTPLHFIVVYQRIVSDFSTIHSIITNLIEAGAHADVVNNAGLTPIQCATTGVAEIILKSQAKMSLKCLAAQSVKKHRLTYQGQVPKALENFIELHGP